MTANSTGKIECLNPNTGSKMNIDAGIYKLFSKAIYHTLKKSKNSVTYTDIVDGIKKCFKEERTNFKGSVEWYAVTIKNDMVAKGVIETFTEKGKKLHRLKSTAVSK
ncbi:MAG TPA: hypothetical protein VGQ53_16595 [Chitinophagaceae bacterium]|jgi:uncharacterized protein DUF6958|nr:hypothetical protein [Chitinophagaceae bacterium]